jgi:hypothetical protein
MSCASFRLLQFVALDPTFVLLFYLLTLDNDALPLPQGLEIQAENQMCQQSRLLSLELFLVCPSLLKQWRDYILKGCQLLYRLKTIINNFKNDNFKITKHTFSSCQTS